MTEEISVEEFHKLDIRVGKILFAEDFPEAIKPAYKLTIDFGKEIGIKNSSAQITKLYSIAELKDKFITAVVNVPSKRIAGLQSEVLVLGVQHEHGAVILLSPEREASPGDKIA